MITHIDIYLVHEWSLLVFSTRHRNQWNLCLEVYRNTLIQHTYLATHQFILEPAKLD